MAKSKYTYMEVRKEFEDKGYILISTESDYKNVNSKLQYVCKKHKDKGIQYTDFTHLHHHGKGCKYCGREKSGLSRRVEINYEEHKKLAESKGFTYITTRRDNGKQVIDFICNNHKELGVQTMTKYNMMRPIKGCKYCSGKNLPEWYVIQKLKSISPHIELLDDYKNLTTPINFWCSIHNRNGRNTMQSLLKGAGCYECGLEKLSNAAFTPNKEVERRIQKMFPEISLIQYNGAVDQSIWKCNKHNEVFYKEYCSFFEANVSGCKKCKDELERLSSIKRDENFRKKLKLVHPELILIDNYINRYTHVRFYCTEHESLFYSTPVNILSRLKCCDKSKKKHKEEIMCKTIEQMGYTITRQKVLDGCKDKRDLWFDCYINEHNVAVEYDGEQHFYPVGFGANNEKALKMFEYTKHHDKIKDNYCKKNNIPLIRVPYYEFCNLEHFLCEKFIKIGIMDSNN